MKGASRAQPGDCADLGLLSEVTCVCVCVFMCVLVCLSVSVSLCLCVHTCI